MSRTNLCTRVPSLNLSIIHFVLRRNSEFCGIHNLSGSRSFSNLKKPKQHKATTSQQMPMVCHGRSAILYPNLKVKSSSDNIIELVNILIF